MIIKDKVRQEDLEVPFIKAVIDMRKEIISVKCDLHIDCAEELIKEGSNSNDLWGFNIHPDGSLDFISLINIRPSENRSMDIQDEEIKTKIREIFKKFFKE